MAKTRSMAKTRWPWFRWPRSLRWRIQAWYAAILILSLIAFGGMLHWESSRAIWNDIDNDLTVGVRILEGSMRMLPPPGFDPMGGRPPRRGPGFREGGPPLRDDGPPGPPSPPFPSSDNRGPPFSPRDRRPPRPFDWSAFDRLAPARLLNPDFPALRIVWGRDGRILHQNGDTSFAPEWGSIDVNALTPDRVLIRSRGRARVALLRGPGESTVCVAIDVQPELDRIRHLSWLLAFSGLAVSSLGLLGGAWCLQRTLQPMREMQETASNIRSDNLNQRLNVESMDMELAEFAQSINAMLDRVEAGFEQQRQFAADASHELRTPLAIVLSSTEHALSRDRSAEAYRTELEKCQRAAQRMRSLVDALLTLSRLDASNPTLPTERVQLDQICRDQVELHQEVAAQHEVEIISTLESCPLNGHAGTLERMVANLLLNAILYNRPGGSVTVALFKKREDVILEITDSGIGIPEEEREHLFKRFYRVDKARSRQTGGSGLGLAICDLVVQLHQGKLEVDSELGIGSTFRVILPDSRSVVGRMIAE